MNLSQVNCTIQSSEERPEDQPADGARLLEQLNALDTEQAQPNEFEIQPVGCLWTCDKPCAVAPSPLPTNRPTCLRPYPPMQRLLPCSSLVNAISIARLAIFPGSSFLKRCNR